jgi:hypothetical protein
VSASSSVSPVVDHLVDLALREAEFAADPAGVDAASVTLRMRQSRGDRLTLVTSLWR